MKGLNDMSKRKIRLLADYVVRQIFDCVAVESKAKIKVVYRRHRNRDDAVNSLENRNGVM